MRILLTGGSACGKSTFAEYLAVRMPSPRYYLATMRPFDEEAILRIIRHQKTRQAKGFLTRERDVDIAGVVLADKATVLLECLCNLMANELFDETGVVDERAFERVLEGIVSLENRCDNLIVVTNDVGSESFGMYSASTQLYVRLLGRLNAVLAARFDVVYELVCGIPLALKGTKGVIL
jgi:adenosylcobinamide kinase/adenosylcobinamide-phosphate guanylyltransferase